MAVLQANSCQIAKNCTQNFPRLSALSASLKWEKAELSGHLPERISIREGCVLTAFVLVPGLVSDDRVWRCLKPVLRDFGDIVDADITGYDSITDMANAILETVIGDLVVFGHSLGGRVAMEMARIEPERVRGLVLANTGHRPARPGEEVRRQEMVDLGNQSMRDLAAVWLPPMLDPARIDDQTLLQDLTQMVTSTTAKVHERQIKALLDRPDAARSIGNYQGPVLLMTGAQDQWSPVEQHREIEALVTFVELAIIEDAGHFMPVEQPAAVAERVSLWLDQREFLWR